MRTTHVLTVSPSMLCAGGCTWSGEVCLVLGGVPGLGGAPGPGGVPGQGTPDPGEVYLVPGGVPGAGVYLVRYSPLLTEWQTPLKT